MTGARYRIFGRDDLVDRNQIRDLIRGGEIDSSTDLAAEGSDQWRQAGGHREPVQRQTNQSKVVWVVALLLIAIGLVVGASSVSNVFNGIASLWWPSTEGQFIYAQTTRDVSGRRVGRQRGSTWFTLDVGYKYSVNGQVYHSNTIAFGTELSSALFQRSRIQAAKPLLVYYDPDAPSRAVLDPGVTFVAAVRFLIGGAFVFVGALVAFAPFLITRIACKIAAIRLGR